MKKTMMMTLALTAFAAIAAPRPGPAPHRGPAPRPAPVVSRPAPRPAPRPIPRPAPPHHRHHESFWGRGGRNFWPGFIGGAVSTVLFSPPPPPPVVQSVVIGPVLQPAVTQVWIEGRWIDQIQSNGTIVRIWQPGHYEQIVISQ